MSMNGRRWLGIAGIVAAAGAFGAVAACSAKAGDAGQPAGGDVAAEQAAGQGEGRMRAVTLIREVLGELDLTAEQEPRVDALVEKVAAIEAEHLAARQAVDRVLADGVRAGTIDLPAVESAMMAARGVLEARRDAAAELANQLHAALTPDQRSDLVGAIEDRIAQRMLDKGAHHHHGMKGDKVARLLRGVELDEAQRGRVETALEEARAAAKAEHEAREAEEATEGSRHERHAAMRDKALAALGAFEGESFDARQFLPESLDGIGKHGHGARRAAMLAAILPLLTDAQRTELADRMSEPAPEG